MTVPTAGQVGSAPADFRGIGLYVLAILLLSVMDVMIKWVSADYPIIQIVAFRAVFGMVPILAVLAWRHQFAQLRTRRPSVHVLRGVIGLAAGFLFFTAFSVMPLADAYAIAFASPLFITMLSVPLLGEAVGPRRWAAVLVGFAGVLVILRPGVNGIDQFLTLGALAALGGTFLYSLSVMLIRRFGRTETGPALLFHTALTSAVLASILAIPDFVAPSPAGWAWLVAIGLVGGVGTIFLTEAFRTARPVVLAPFEYTAMVWAILFGVAIWGDVPDAWIGAGSVIVIGAGLYILHRERRRRTPLAGSERLAATPLAGPQRPGEPPIDS